MKLSRHWVSRGGAKSSYRLLVVRREAANAPDVQDLANRAQISVSEAEARQLQDECPQRVLFPIMHGFDNPCVLHFCAAGSRVAAKD